MSGVCPMAPVLMKAPPNTPSLKCFQVALYQTVRPLPGTQLKQLCPDISMAWAKSARANGPLSSQLNNCG